MKKIIFLIGILSVSPSFAWEHGPLKCEGLYGIIGRLDKVAMLKTSEDSSSTIVEGFFEKYKFRVEWNYGLDTLYTSIAVSGDDKFFSTMRVPTENHNDSFGEFRDETGFRLGITCAFEKMQK